MHVFSLYLKCEFSFKNSSLKTLAVFLPIFVADTKIIFHYNFVAPLGYLRIQVLSTCDQTGAEKYMWLDR